MAIVARRVKNCCDDYQPVCLDYFVNNAVRKMFGITPADVLPECFWLPEHRVVDKSIEH
jgi:hypothetical protein